MIAVKVVGAGSIGNHLAHGCREQGWSVTIVDHDPKALQRARETIYPSRYGEWDDAITLSAPSEVESRYFDIVIVGTPPASHLTVATAELSGNPPKILLIEKPLSHPEPEAIRQFLALTKTSTTRVLVGYNHRMKENTQKFLEIAQDPALGKLTGLKSHMLESWDGILNAHFWMNSEKDSYLAFTEKGGGALLEHSHALNLFLHFAHYLGQGPVTSVNASIDWVQHESGQYDKDSRLTLTLRSGVIGEVRQDLHTWPATKEAIAVFEHGSVVWEMADSEDKVSILTPDGSEKTTWTFPKIRPDDFRGEISHLGDLLQDPGMESPLDLNHGVEVLEVAVAAFESSRSDTAVSITRI